MHEEDLWAKQLQNNIACAAHHCHKVFL
eukprot:SAG11_NODE_5662_length_1492_cov_1.208184_1_plen_27_part_01